MEPQEVVVASVQEQPKVAPSNVCGIAGCQTIYRDPIVMQRHRERVHGVDVNLNQPLPRNQDIKLA